MWYIHTMDYSAITKRNYWYILQHKQTLDHYAKGNQAQKTTYWFHLCKMSRKCKCIVTEVDESLPRVRGQGKWEWLLMGAGFLSGVMKMFWSWWCWWLIWLNILKTIGYCTFNGWTVWYVNYTSIKLFNKETN